MMKPKTRGLRLVVRDDVYRFITNSAKSPRKKGVFVNSVIDEYMKYSGMPAQLRDVIDRLECLENAILKGNQQ